MPWSLYRQIADTLCMATPVVGERGRLSSIVMVKDEEEYVGFAVLAVLPYVDEMIVVDGGSTDGTLRILERVQREHDPLRKMRIHVDTRPRKQLIHVRTDMVRQCTGEWIWRVEGDEVHDDATAKTVAGLLKGDALPEPVRAAGWPYWFFVDDLSTIVRVGEPHTFATIAVRNCLGLHAAHHKNDASATFWDEGWFDGEGRNVSIHWPQDNAVWTTTRFGVHHYAWFKRTSRHREYARGACKVPCLLPHPEVFGRHDFRALMRDPVFVKPGEDGSEAGLAAGRDRVWPRAGATRPA
jgi:glycosyltransferase involved in cell wall biosynthesis